MSDTTIVFHISRELTDVDGASLEGENSFAVIMPPLRVVSTDPFLNQQYVEISYLQITITMNNIIDESTISNSTSITPNVSFDVSTYAYEGFTHIKLLPDLLLSNTNYTVTIDTSLKDFYGKNLKQPYIFNFVTK